MPLWKIASGETSNAMLLDRILDTGKPVLLSTGMSPIAEIDAAVARVRARKVDVGVFQCTTAYPCPPEKIGLNLIPFYRERYGCRVGLSDHSATIYPGPRRRGARHGHARGARHAVARDVRARRDRVGHDRRSCGSWWTASASSRRCARIRSTRTPWRRRPRRCATLFTRSVVAARDLPAGTVLRASTSRQEAGHRASAATRLDEVIGRRLRGASTADQVLAADDYRRTRAL